LPEKTDAPYQKHCGGDEMVHHYHIIWESGTVDWQRFDTREAAEVNARVLTRLRETYTIGEFDETCMKCNEMERRASGSISRRRAHLK
jgi:hypothetical protein